MILKNHFETAPLILIDFAFIFAYNRIKENTRKDRFYEEY